MYDTLLTLLNDLDGVSQDPKYHPEGDALYHSLQVYECARRETEDSELRMAALVHDVGKAVNCLQHAEIGANMLEGIASPRVLWLVQHHLDLLKTPKKTRRLLRNSERLSDLEKLRRWDLAGRRLKVWVPEPADAVADLINFMNHQALQQEYEGSPKS